MNESPRHIWDGMGGMVRRMGRSVGRVTGWRAIRSRGSFAPPIPNPIPIWFH